MGDPFAQAQKETVVDDIHKHQVYTPYQEYPRILHKAGAKELLVTNDKEKAKGLKEGWSLTPVLPEEPKAPVVDPPAL